MRYFKNVFIVLMMLFFLGGCAGFQLFPDKEYCPPELAKDSYILKWVDPGSADLALMMGTAMYLEERPDKAPEVLEVANYIIAEMDKENVTYDAFQALLIKKLGPLMYVAATPLLERFKGMTVIIGACDRSLIKGQAEKQKTLAGMVEKKEKREKSVGVQQ